eukprot:6487883-Amphidinium_carterae.1
MERGDVLSYSIDRSAKTLRVSSEFKAMPKIRVHTCIGTSTLRQSPPSDCSGHVHVEGRWQSTWTKTLQAGAPL